ncbi:MAG: cbb3-type cytochrome c oxidase N-terminal domain-containing protein [Chitinophagaceae bacterium]|nr:cbb3-type cytochrome c oxidase N-terminal domain-containing protein [Chitinophagaceae bacterium]
MRNKIKYIPAVLTAVLLMPVQSVLANEPSGTSALSNPMVVALVGIMLLLLIIIALLAGLLLNAAKVTLKKNREESKSGSIAALLVAAIFLPATLSAQDTGQTAAQAVVETIGGMTATQFYVMLSVIFLELIIIIALLINIKILLKTEKETVLAAVEVKEAKKTQLSWWDRFNKFRPVTQEAELDLGHEYDGIRELNNRLPPWWLYGFYVTILFAVIYLWRFHVSHTGPSSKQEYDMAVAKAELKIKEYLKTKGEAVDENTVQFLTSPEDIAEGKTIYLKSCAACHKESGAGDVGPNLTDNYWMHGNDIKSIFKTVRYGINAMPQWQNMYSNKQIAQVSSYIRTLHGTNPPNAKPPQGTEVKEETAAAKPLSDSLKNN